ncbi:hypothetical protein EDD37DRAFT_642983 [Exophiala viscosa]|uniref:Uncharacterized protein n=1 Tax=Exophiala viscosa TaxID=2486360 RepID=A0AAN6DQK4_9EURO|nr:hypothetical protein EDD36DRAFT_77518 [Exophiala viscosa]KAI1619712.1 hypothetical protein EDD37DRAFT_642983 [Exophiala viscosa]
MWPFTSAQAGFSESIPPQPEHLAPQALPLQPIEELSTTQDAQPLTITGWPDSRLSIQFPIRAALVMGTAFVSGFGLGSSQGGTKAAFRYRAENAHRLPQTQTGWYLYQKSKNYHAMLGGVREGCRFGAICTGWATLFMVTEEMVDLSRSRLLARRGDDVASGQRDAASTVIAGTSLAGIYSWKRGLDHFATVRTAKTALKFSLMYGLVQDLFATVRGEPPAYVTWMKRKIYPDTDTENSG